MTGVGGIMATLALGHLMTVMSPGPNQALVIATAARSRVGGLFVALGAWPAGAFWAAMGLAGMGEAIRSLPWLEIGIRLACGAYLFYLGARMIRQSFRGRGLADLPATERGWGGLLMMGFISNITNAKAIGYYASIFAATGAYALPFGWRLVAIFGMPAIGFMVNSTLALLISAPPAKRVYARLSHWFDRVSGAVLIGFGVKLLAAA